MFITIFIPDFLGKDTKWRDEDYPEQVLIRRGQNPEELILTYDGSKKTMTLLNPTSRE
jgi:hypothetical protein